MPNLNDIPYLPFQFAPAGMDLGNVVAVPTGGNILFVRSTGPADYDPPALTGRILPSLQTAMFYCRSNAGDTIFVLPGHAESVSSAAYFSNLVAGTRIVGLGDGQLRPTLTWTTAASTWLLNKANVTVENMRLLVAGPATGSLTVTAPITVSAAGVTIRRCYIEVANAAARLATTPITVAAGADDFAFLGNVVWGAVAGTPTDGLLVSAAVARPVIVSNDFQMATSATGRGVIRFSAAATEAQIKNNYLANNLASSTVALQGTASATGMVADNYLGIQAAGAATAITTPGNWFQVQNFLCQPGKNGILGTDGGAST